MIAAHVQLRQSRRMLRGDCPFHQDIAESFMVYPSKEIFKCFGCGLEGGIAEFSEAIRGI